MTAFIISRDYVTPKGEEGYAVGTVGPRTATDKDVERLKHPKESGAVRFRLLDDDRNVYYHGWRLEESECDDMYESEPELAPLDCFGTPNAGAAIQEEKNADGEWEAIN